MSVQEEKTAAVTKEKNFILCLCLCFTTIGACRFDKIVENKEQFLISDMATMVLMLAVGIYLFVKLLSILLDN